MRIVYGTKAITEDDIFDGCGRPRNILGFIGENLSDMLDQLRDAIMHFNYEGYQNDFKFDFIPLDLVEEFILYTAVSKSVNLALDFMATRDNMDRTKRIVDVAREKLNVAMEKYIDSYDERYCNIEDTVCAAIIYDVITKNVKDICVCVPRKIISKVKEDMEYCCERCGKKQYTSELPDMMYTIKDGKVIYYCKDCCNDNDKVSYVGDYWPPKE